VRVVGLDACKHGWVGVVLDAGKVADVVCERTIGEAVTAAGPVAVVGIDIPQGFPVATKREAERLVAPVVGPRRSSLFATPPRDALLAATYAEANRLCAERVGWGLSAQAYALRARVLEVDAWLPSSPAPAYECFPELSFRTMGGRPLPDPKSSWAGASHRRALLLDEGLRLDGDLGLSGKRVAPDDVLDAAAVAWTASRIAAGTAVSYPDPPEEVDGGRLAAIWA
jgi:predicted RNase H-like nuclease